MVRQAHREGRTRLEVLDMFTKANPHRPDPDREFLYERALGRGSNLREYIIPSKPHKRRAWRAEELDILMRGKSLGQSVRILAEELGRSLRSVKRRLDRINATGIPRKPTTAVRRKPRTWTRADDRQLEDMWRQGMKDSQIAQRLSWKPSLGSVAGRRESLGLVTTKRTRVNRAWTAADDDKLRQLCAEMTLTNREIGLRLMPPRSTPGVKARKKVLGLCGDQVKPWGDVEDAALRRLMEQGLSISKIIDALPVKRTYDSVRYRARELNLRFKARGERTITPRAWTDEETEKLLSLRDSGMQLTNIAQDMGRSEYSIRNRLTRLKSENVQSKGDQT